jgi:hypothetical protein
MATSGLRVKRPRSSIDAVSRTVAALTAAAMLLIASGCASTVSFGSPPRTDRLDTLRVGTSSADEVTRALGEPRGRGGVQFTPDSPAGQVWFYEYIQSEGKKARMKMLLVFMDKDRYMGHMWFAAAQLVEVTQ